MNPPTETPAWAGTEGAVVARTSAPRTRRTLAADLRTLGVRPGDVLLVHTALSALGWVVGREVAVIEALLDAVGPTGTITVPTQTGGNSDPAEWRAPPVPESWWETIRAEMPGFDPARTPTDGMGSLPETLRSWPGAVRSHHPQASFAAIGHDAATLMARHDLDCRFGARSPLAALAAAGARVLMLGTDYATCTAFHLGETLAPNPPTEPQGCAILDPTGTSRWVTFTDVVADERDFLELGAAFEASHPVTSALVGSAATRLFDLRAAADFAATWVGPHRQGW